MQLFSYRLRNFRRLKNVYVELAPDISIFVGANNSGKTSATQAFQSFLEDSRGRFSIYDFSSEVWEVFKQLGDLNPGDDGWPGLPTIDLDLWFKVESSDLHRVMALLPSLKWESSYVGIRVSYAPKDEPSLIGNYREASNSANTSKLQFQAENDDGGDYHPWPQDLWGYLEKELRKEYDLKYFVLDQAQFDEEFRQKDGYSPLELVADAEKNGHKILKSILKVDFLHAQRHLSDVTTSGRAENLSRHLSQFYKRNLERREDDYAVLRILAQSEAQLDTHLAQVFAPTLNRLSELGYPGLANPQMVIKSALDPASILNQEAKVHYALDSDDGNSKSLTLPDNYNGLGFKNLIYMVVELLDLHARWLDSKENRPPLHIIFIEEPEAHLHAQLQQVFIRQVLSLLEEDDGAKDCKSQLIVTTHSPHVLYERGFQPIRYFRRVQGASPSQNSEVLNLSSFYRKIGKNMGDFLERYLRLTHCDLLFADAAIFVEGNVERILLPLMIDKSAPDLKSCCLSILEVGGAFAYRFRELVEFLGITTLVITDIDSVLPATVADGGATAAEANEDEFEESQRKGSACQVDVPGAVTSNQTLIQWLPKKLTIAELRDATAKECTQDAVPGMPCRVHVAYQRHRSVMWQETSGLIAGRTLEEDFALENLEWTQAEERQDLGLRIKQSASLSLDELSKRLHKRVNGSSFNKTSFALQVLTEDPNAWHVPTYIGQGLEWLAKQIAPEVRTLQRAETTTFPAEETVEATT